MLTSGTSIPEQTFWECSNLVSITIPDSVTSIGERAFYNCSRLKNITFKGTVEQWIAISKDSTWSEGTSQYTIYCTDGTIAKGETVTLN